MYVKEAQAAVAKAVVLPIMWSNGTGASVMKRIAAPMIGGMVSSTLLTLLVIPAIYSLYKEREVTRKSSRNSASVPLLRN